MWHTDGCDDLHIKIESFQLRIKKRQYVHYTISYQTEPELLLQSGSADNMSGALAAAQHQMARLIVTHLDGEAQQRAAHALGQLTRN